MDVLEHEYRRPRLGEPLEEHACGGEEVLLVADGAFFETEEVREPRLCKTPFLWIRYVLLDRGAQLLAGARRLFVLDDPGAPANHVGQRPERNAVAVREAASGVPPDVAGQPVDVFLELPGEARLSDTADPDDGDEMRPAVFRGGVVELLDEPQFAIASHERRLETAGLRRSTDEADDPDRLPELDRLGLALERVAARVLEDDGGFVETLRRLSDEDGSGIGRRLDPGCGVDEVAGDHALALGAERDRRFAREHTGTRAKLGRTDLRSERRDGCEQVERRANRSLGVVFLCDRRSPHGHDRVTDELLDRAAVALDHRARGLEVPREELAHVLGVAGLRERGVADDVGEEDRDEAALGCGRGCGQRRWRGRGQRRAAFPAELHRRRIRRSA